MDATVDFLDSIYVRNLNERVKPAELEQALRWAFDGFGQILGIVIKRSLTRKGQAFIAFDNVDSVKEALKLDGFSLFDKPMQVAMARTPSDATVAKEGQAALDAHQRRRQAMKGEADCPRNFLLFDGAHSISSRTQASRSCPKPTEAQTPCRCCPRYFCSPIEDRQTRSWSERYYS